jgi:hypothetical protein
MRDRADFASLERIQHNEKECDRGNQEQHHQKDSETIKGRLARDVHKNGVAQRPNEQRECLYCDGYQQRQFDRE